MCLLFAHKETSKVHLIKVCEHQREKVIYCGIQRQGQKSWLVYCSLVFSWNSWDIKKTQLQVIFFKDFETKAGKLLLPFFTTITAIKMTLALFFFFNSPAIHIPVLLKGFSTWYIQDQNQVTAFIFSLRKREIWAKIRLCFTQSSHHGFYGVTLNSISEICAMFSNVPLSTAYHSRAQIHCNAAGCVIFKAR